MTDIMAEFFSIQSEKWDDKNYPYWSDIGYWYDHLGAHQKLTTTIWVGSKNPKQRIVLKHVIRNSDDTVSISVVKVVFENGEWVSAEHDPRAADPQFREYLRLKEIYE